MPLYQWILSVASPLAIAVFGWILSDRLRIESRMDELERRIAALEERSKRR